MTVAEHPTSPATADAVLGWLLERSVPAVRRLALVRLLGRSASDPDVRALDAGLADDRWVRVLLAGEWRAGVDGRVRVHPYKKWGGAHWRLVALAELGVTVDTPGARPALEEAFAQVVEWLLSPGHVDAVPKIRGLYRRCGSQEGNALWAASKLGLGGAGDVDALADNLLRWHWPDGGWNCDKKPAAHHSSFNESFAPLRGLAAYRERRRRATDGQGDTGPDDSSLGGAIDRAAEFFLRHRVVESERTGELANPRLGLLRWPPYWHYGLLSGLRALQEAGQLGDARVSPALDRLRAARQADGTWQPDGRWWGSPRATSGANVEIVDWGREGEARMLTLQALEVLRAAEAS